MANTLVAKETLQAAVGEGAARRCATVIHGVSETEARGITEYVTEALGGVSVLLELICTDGCKVVIILFVPLDAAHCWVPTLADMMDISQPARSKKIAPRFRTRMVTSAIAFADDLRYMLAHWRARVSRWVMCENVNVAWVIGGGTYFGRGQAASTVLTLEPNQG
ncbi:hypothetical protein AK812_SmicGene17035 [Symbiodinium microadriaticum]|uniref:Uncharacterized protein n=1 Tax=Symbiodinium microadriaticum TaxID=2951 RepID=A0A1Q9DYY4_SYMMI|nr:hypothetical protein AK812_SmicGene17035 [Symbiodinium microadriaticum]